MRQSFARQKLSDHVYYTSVVDPKFKRNRLSVHLLTPHSEATAAANALLPFLLRKASEDYPDFTLLNERLCELYDAVLTADVGVVGATQLISLSLSTLDDRYALEGDAVVRACADLLCGIATRPRLMDGVFPATDFTVERRALLDAIDAELNDKRRYALTRFARAMFAGQLGAVPRYGSREAVESLTAAATAEAYARLRASAGVEILFVGGGDPSAARDRFAGAFASGDRTGYLPAEVHRAQPPKEVVERLDVTQSKLVLGYASGIGLDDPLASAARLMATVLGGTPHSLLFTEVREKRSLCYYCTARFDRARGVLAVDAGIEAADRQATAEAVGEQLCRLAAGDFSAEQLEAAKLSIADSMHAIGDTLGGIESYTLGQLLYGRDENVEQELSALLAVTKDQVAEAAGRLRLDTTYFLTGKEESM